MPNQYTNFSMSIPEELHGKLKQYADKNIRTMTSVILETLRWRLEAEEGTKQRCVTGEPCALPLLGFNRSSRRGINPIFPDGG